MPARKTRRKDKGGAGIPPWLIGGLLLILVALVVLRLTMPAGKRAGLHTPEGTGRAADRKAMAPKAPPPKPGEYSREDQPRLPKPPDEVPAETEVAIVLDDVGYRLDLARRAADLLPTSVTFAVIPFLPYSKASARLLHRRGYSIILHAPMEPLDSGRWRPGPGTLMHGMPSGEVERILAKDLEAVPFAEGVNNHMGSLATTDRALMRSVMRSLKSRSLYFLDSRTTAETVAYEEAKAEGLPASFRSVFLDDRDEVGAIMEQLDHLVARAGKEGALVGIGHLRPKTIQVLSRRMPYWTARGIRFRPLREVVH